MKKLKVLILAVGMSLSSPSQALFGVGDVVFDPTAVAQLAMQYGIEEEQLSNLLAQLQQMKMIYDTMHNDFGGALKRDAFNQMMSQLPPEFQSLVNGGGNFGNWQGVASDKIIYGINSFPIQQDSQTAKEFEENRTLAAKHSATFMKLVEDSEFNFQSIAQLIDKLKAAETVGEKLDNIAESNLINATLLNQIIKNQATAESYKASLEIQSQRQKELGMMMKPGQTPRFGNVYTQPQIQTIGSDGVFIGD